MTKKYDLISIGHIDNAILDYMGDVSRFIGGAVYYSSFAAKRAGASVCAVTKLNEKDMAIVEELKSEVDVVIIPSTETTSVLNIFETADVDKRKVKLLTQADPFQTEDIPDFETQIYHLGGLFVGEIPDELIPFLAAKGKVALDLQGMLRNSENGSFAWKDWPKKLDCLPLITYLKADSLESEVITNNPDREAAAKMMNKWGAQEVMVSHSSEVIICAADKIYRAPFNPSNLSGRTGRGDTVFVSYIVRRMTHGIQESLDFAAAMCSIKMEKPGPFKGEISEVEARMKTLRA